MSNSTQINPKLQSAPSTVINAELQTSPSTVINNEITEEHPVQQITIGSVIGQKYTVVDQLDVSSGEADLFVCTYQHKKYVAKAYKRKIAIKDDVVKALKRIKSPYVAKVFDTFIHNDLPVEIIPYYKNGSLQGQQLSYDELVKVIIPNINEGLHALHKEGIIHKDLKPSNIMRCDDGTSVAIIDFGISSVRDATKSLLITQTGMTPQYSAPETYRNIYLEESDYYSFGITLFELFCGYVPYSNMTSEEIERYISVEKLPYPEEMPILLQDFISALTYYDLTNRNKKSNPNRRWTYEEVKKWLNGENLVIPGQGISNNTMPSFEFNGESYTDPTTLISALALNWESGKKLLFRGELTKHFRSFNQEIAKACFAAEEEASRTNGKDDIIFWKLLYKINPKLQGFYWKGQTFESLPALGRDMLERLWRKDKSQFAYYASILTEELLVAYVTMTAPKNTSLMKAATAIQDSYKLEVANHTDFMRTYYLMAYTLSGQKLLSIDGNQFRTVGELAEYMRTQLDLSFEAFENLCHRLVDYDGNLDLQLESWLVAIGKQKEIEKWRELMNE